MRRLLPLVLLLALPASASAATDREHAALVDTRKGTAEVPAAVRAARAKFDGFLSVDRLTGAVRFLGRTDGYLTGPQKGTPRAIALRWAREHLTLLGLEEADLRGLRVASEYRAPNGVTRVIFQQTHRGIPALDSTLRVNVAGDGRVVNVGGRPRTALRVPSTKPALSAERAVDAALTAVGAPRGRASYAKLRIAATGARSARLVWRLWLEESDRAAWHVVVDANTGRLIRRANQVKFAGKGLAWDYYPGAPGGGGVQREVDFTRWLEGPDRLRGNFTHVYNDADNTEDCLQVTCEDPMPEDIVMPQEEIRPQGVVEGDWLYEYTPVPSPAGNCPEAGCTWNHLVNGSWLLNRDQDGTQVFFFINTFAEHLKAPPISFDERANFQFANASAAGKGGDGIYASAMDSAAVAAGRPIPVLYSDNANMLTRPDGTPPRMQMYLFEPIPLAPALDYPFSDVSGGGDASVVYHEFTHGLSNRLIVDAEGEGAVNAIQSGAMGEAWSDFYAHDFIIKQGFEVDTEKPGEIQTGKFVDGGQNLVRTQPVDCRPGDAAAACPRRRGVNAEGGGYTYEEFGRIIPGGPQVHADGEIWSETLMDFRRRMVADHGEQKGSDRVRGYITRAMELSVDEPSYIDMRNAILQADMLAGKRDQRRIWEVFAARGMGASASSVDGADTAPVAAFDLPAGLPASDMLGPAVTIDSPAENGVVRAESATIAGTAADDAGVVSLKLDEVVVKLTENGAWSVTLKNLKPGRRKVQVVARDIEQRVAAATRTLFVDAKRPALGKVRVRRRGKRLLISGTTRDDVGAARVRIGSRSVPVARGGRFFMAVRRGKPRSVKVVVRDRAGRTSRSKKLRLR